MSDISPLSRYQPSHDPIEKVIDSQTGEVIPEEEISHSSFAKMFRGVPITKKQFNQFLNNCIYVLIQDCKRAEAKGKRASRRILASVQGRRFD